MENCKHDIEIKNVNGLIITYCKVCGKILSQQTAQTTVKQETPNSDLRDNGGQILHG